MPNVAARMAALPAEVSQSTGNQAIEGDAAATVAGYGSAEEHPVRQDLRLSIAEARLWR